MKMKMRMKMRMYCFLFVFVIFFFNNVIMGKLSEMIKKIRVENKEKKKIEF